MNPLVRAAPRRFVPTILVGAVLALVLLPWQAAAAPTGTAVKAYKTPCTGSVCDSDDTPLASGATVDGSIVVVASSSSGIGLSWVLLEAEGPRTSWVCLRKWSGGGTKSFSNQINWNTYQWPSAAAASGCSATGAHGDVTPNGAYTIRVTAHEDVTNEEGEPATLSIRLNNAPWVPAWESSPEVVGDTESRPVVTLRWRANAEPDVTGYDLIREDPDGRRRAVAVSADDPARQGCARSGSVYSCEDGTFPDEDFAGRYEYTLVAYRAGASGGRLASPASETLSASLREPPPPPPPSPEPVRPARPRDEVDERYTPSSSPSSRVLGRRSVADSREFFTGSYSRTLPYGNQDTFVPGGTLEGVRPETTELAQDEPGAVDDEEAPRLLLVPVAGGLMALLGAAHLLRVLTGR